MTPGRRLSSVVTRAFGKDHEIEFTARTPERFQLFDPIWVQLSPLQQKADAAAQELLDPGRMPDLAVAQHHDRITASPPANRAEQHGINEADVIAHQQRTVAGGQPVEMVNAPKIGQRKNAVRAEPQEPLDENQRARDAGLANLGHDQFDCIRRNSSSSSRFSARNAGCAAIAAANASFASSRRPNASRARPRRAAFW